MGSDSVNQMFQKHLLEEGHLHYGEFMNDLSRLIVSVVCSGAPRAKRASAWAEPHS